MSTIKILESGTYGCVYYRGFDCNGKTTKKNVSKVSSQKRESYNELQISKKIKKHTPLPNKRFVLVESICKSNLSFFSKKHKANCNIITRNPNNTFYVIQSNYVKNISLNDYFNNYENSLYDDIYVFEYLLESIKILVKSKVVHYDLHFKNALLSSDTKIPYIIDFGLSLCMESFVNNTVLNYKELKNKFFTFEPSWWVWCLEIHVIAWFMENSKKIHLTNENIEYIISEFVERNSLLKPFSPDFKKQYYTSAYEFYSQFAFKRRQIVILSLLKHWKTWDLYTLSGMFLLGEGNNSYNDFFMELLLSNIHPNPLERVSVDEVLESINDFKLQKVTNEDLSLSVSSYNLSNLSNSSNSSNLENSELLEKTFKNLIKTNQN